MQGSLVNIVQWHLPYQGKVILLFLLDHTSYNLFLQRRKRKIYKMGNLKGGSFGAKKIYQIEMDKTDK